MRCKNCSPECSGCYCTGKEDNPRGRGYSARHEKEGQSRKGNDGRMYLSLNGRWKKVKNKRKTSPRMELDKTEQRLEDLKELCEEHKNILDCGGWEEIEDKLDENIHTDREFRILKMVIPQIEEISASLSYFKWRDDGFLEQDKSEEEIAKDIIAEYFKYQVPVFHNMDDEGLE